MTATAAQFLITDEQLEAANGASYASLEVPGDYEARLVRIEDYDNRSKGRSHGWIAYFSIEGLEFRTWIAHSDAARWKLIEFTHAFRPGFFEDRNPDGTSKPVNPNEFVGETVGAHVVLDEEMSPPMKVIDSLFSLTEDEPTVEDVPTI
jgi:hypothetical protein